MMMRRRHFLQSISSIAGMMSARPLSAANHELTETPSGAVGQRKAVLVRAGNSRQANGINVAAASQQTLVRSFDSLGKLVSLVLPVEQRTPWRGAPLHVHHDVDEWIYILGGEFVSEVGGERKRLRQGDSLLLPMKIPHRWSIAQTVKAGAIHLYTPAGVMDEFFDPDPPGAKELTWDERKAMFEKYQVTLLGPPLSREEIDSTS
jgi:mannose-6-phosphate isomerase-like protein (cupin superfamily)